MRGGTSTSKVLITERWYLANDIMLHSLYSVVIIILVSFEMRPSFEADS